MLARVFTAMILLATAGVTGVQAVGIFGFDEIVEAHLPTIGVDPEDVRSVQLDLQRRDVRGKRRDTGVTAWLRLDSCESGFLIIEMDMEGRIRQVYTRGGCEVEGVRRHR